MRLKAREIISARYLSKEPVVLSVAYKGVRIVSESYDLQQVNGNMTTAGAKKAFRLADEVERKANLFVSQVERGAELQQRLLYGFRPTGRTWRTNDWRYSKWLMSGTWARWNS